MSKTEKFVSAIGIAVVLQIIWYILMFVPRIMEMGFDTIGSFSSMGVPVLIGIIAGLITLIKTGKLIPTVITFVAMVIAVWIFSLLGTVAEFTYSPRGHISFGIMSLALGALIIGVIDS